MRVRESVCESVCEYVCGRVRERGRECESECVCESVRECERGRGVESGERVCVCVLEIMNLRCLNLVHFNTSRKQESVSLPTVLTHVSV